MPEVTLAQESRTLGAFYVPYFEVVIGGTTVSSTQLGDVVQLTYKDSIKELDSFELVVNNWDAVENTFKFVGSETTQSLRGDTDASQRYHLFEPRADRKVTVSMGYVDHLRVMLTGTLTSMEPNFPSGGAPTLTVRGLNVLFTLRRKQYSGQWFDKRDSDIAKEIERARDRGARRFPLDIEIDNNARQDEPEIPYVAQQTQYDIDFLFGRARQRGYVIFIQEEDRQVRGSRHRLYFGPSHTARAPGLRDVTYNLEYGASLVEFRPTLSTTRQVSAVTVRGWNRRTRERIVKTVDTGDSRFDCNRDLIDLLPRATDPQSSREEVVVNEPMYTCDQAGERAYAILSDRIKSIVTATGSTVGLPDLRAGKRVIIEGIGSRFGGAYFVTETTHTISESGYTTRFTARRENDCGGSA